MHHVFLRNSLPRETDDQHGHDDQSAPDAEEAGKYPGNHSNSQIDD
jgi:hypothetical protein